MILVTQRTAYGVLICLLLATGLPLQPSGRAQAEPVELTAQEIRATLAGNTLVYRHERTGFKWFFAEDGSHLYDPDHGFAVPGQWYVRETDKKLCDWDVNPEIPSCVTVGLDGDRVFLDGGQHAFLLVPGNATDPSDNPGADFDPSRELSLPLDVTVEAPSDALPATLATLSGAWFGTFYTQRDFALIVERIDAQHVDVVYSWGPHKWTGGSPGWRRIKGRIEGNRLFFKVGNFNVSGHVRADGKLEIIGASERWAGMSLAVRWEHPPWESAKSAKLEAPSPTARRDRLRPPTH